MPHVLTRTSSVPATCCQPGFTTMFERVKIANVIKVIGMQIFSASYIVFRKDAFAMRAQSLAATSQARLLLGPANVVRIDPTLVGPPIERDDYRRARTAAERRPLA